MNARERWQRTKDLFARASELPRGERAAFVERESGDDVALARELFELLRTLEETGRFPEIPEHRRVEPPDGFSGKRAGDYELLEEVGRGATGVVYRARNVALGRIEAVKIQPHSFAPSKEQREHFLREARKLGKLDHPGIVRIHAVSEIEGAPYFAMEWIDGHDLATEVSLQRLDVAPRPKGSPLLPPFSDPSYFAAIVEVVAQAAEALHHAHARGIVHRDVKPHNLMLGRDRRVRVADFGIARDANMGSLTRTGEIAGTLHYMSPEQAESKRRPEVTHLTDVYSLGVVLFELLTLHRPFDAPTDREILARITSGTPDRIERWNPRVPKDLRTICEHAMESAANDRYPSAAALAEDLRRFLARDPILARPLGGVTKLGRLLVKRRVSILAAAAAVVLVSGSFSVRAFYDRAAVRKQLSVEVAASIEELRRPSPSSMPRLVLERAAQLEEVEGGLGGDLDEQVRRLRAVQAQRVDERLQFVRELAQRHDERAHALVADSRDDAPTAEQLESELRALAEFAGPLPQDLVNVLEQLKSCALQIDVRSPAGTGAIQIVARRLNETTGAPLYARRIETTRTSDGKLDLRLLAGFYVLYVVQDGVGFSELVRHVHDSENVLTATAWIRNEEEATRGMVPFDGGEFAFERRFRPPGSQSEVVVTGIQVVDPHWIAPELVTLGEYARFVEVEGRHTPPFWPDPLPAEMLDRPVTFISWEEARACAEWLGRRLVTRPEWMLGLEITTAAPIPDGVDVAAIDADWDHWSTDTSDAGIWSWIQRSLRPVADSRSSSHGLKGVLGGVAGWTDTWFFDRVGTKLEPDFNVRYLCGTWGHIPRDAHSKPSAAAIFVKSNVPDAATGIRSARSARVPDTD